MEDQQEKNTWQKNAEDLYQSLDAFMPYYFRFINPIIHQMETEEGLMGENHIKVLMAAEKVGKISPGTISEIFMMPKTTLTTVIRSLMTMDLIQKTPKAGDGRTFQISLSPKGYALIEKMRVNNIRQLGEVFSDLEDREAKVIMEGFHTVRRYFEKKGNFI